MGLPSLVMWEPTERSVVEMMSSRPPMLTTLLRLTEILVLKFQFTLPVKRRASSWTSKPRLRILAPLMLVVVEVAPEIEEIGYL